MSVKLGWIERAMMLVPGYRGYKKRELLREDDRLIRRFVADSLREASNKLQQALDELVKVYGAQLMTYMQMPGNPMTMMQSAAQRIYNVAGMIEHLEMGYSPMFDRIKVNEDELRKLLEIDNKMIGFSQVVKETAEQILAQVRSQRTFDSRLLLTIQQSLDQLEKIVEERRKFLHGGEAVRSGSLGV